MKLICYGDSWTAGHGVELDSTYKESPSPPNFVQLLRQQNSWPRWLAEKLNCTYVNSGVCGIGNKYICNNVIDSIRDGHVYRDDIIIVMFSYPYRYIKYDKENVIDIYNLLEKTLDGVKHFYVNSFYPSFKDFDFDTTKLPYYFINPSGSVSDVLRDYEKNNDTSVWEYGSRSVWNDEKNFFEGDYHPNLLGYRIIGEYIYDQIKDKI